MDKKQVLARDLMTTTVVTVPPAMPVTVLARLMADRGISSAPVTDADGRLLGIVTEADLLRRLASVEDAPVGWLRSLFRNIDKQAEHYARTHGKKAEDVMTTALVTVEGDATAEHCARLMEERGIKRLPVIRDGRLAGIISRADLLRAVLEPSASIGDEMPSRDARIRKALRAEMLEQPWTSSLYVFSDVQDGVVTLQGSVHSEAMRRGLHVLAGRIKEVERVEDQMVTTPLLLPRGFF